MANVEIEDVTGLQLHEHAAQAHAATTSLKPWLQEVRPDVWRRNRNIRKSEESLGRMVMDEVISPHILRVARKAAGMLTIIRKLTLYNPTEGVTVEGREIDLWMNDSATEEDHVEAVRLAAQHDGYTGTVIGLLAPREVEQCDWHPSCYESGRSANSTPCDWA